MKKIYIIHGWSYSIEKWEEIVSLFKKENINAQILKVPGLIYPISKPWTIEDYILWLKKEIKEEKAVLVGHSNGGRIAMGFAEKYPEKVEKLFLIDSAGVYHSSIPIKIKRMVFGNLAEIGKKFTTSKTLRKILYKLARTNDYNKADLVMKQTMVNLMQSDKNKDFSKIKIPTFIIWGQKDTTTPVEDGKFLNSKIKDSKMFFIEDAKHSPQFSHPHEVVKIISKNL